MTFTPWPHQDSAHSDVTSGIEAGERALCVTSPTGGGKSLMMTRLISWGRERQLRSMLLTNRRMLLSQIQDGLAEAGIPFGIRAAGFRPDPSYPVQVSSIQTEVSRVYKRKDWELYPADLLFVDEAHNQANGRAEQFINDYKTAGARVLGFTATPVDLAHLYDRLIVAGTTSELRACGALVPCSTYGPDEPDARNLPPKVKVGEDLSENQIRKAIMAPNIFARVLEAWQSLNPDGMPTLLFAPGVKESIWFCEQFHAAGISAAHIDGEAISYGETDSEGNSVTYRSTQAERDKVRDGSRDGSIMVVCNRFVMREGVDWRWLAHGIFATIFGALSSYLQAGGRLLRAYPGLDQVTIQDHGGNWWRHGSLNSDRVWDLTYGNREIAGMHDMNMREKKTTEPICCPQCHMIRANGARCPKCGYIANGKSRLVVQTDGTLKAMEGDIYKAHRVRRNDNTEKLWVEMYHRARSEKWNATFQQAMAYFFHENHYYPPRNLPLMPTADIDWFRKVRAVPKDDLRQPQEMQRTFA